MNQTTTPISKLSDMTPQQARVLIAQDVLDLLQKEVITTSKGSYVDIDMPHDTDADIQVREFLQPWLKEGSCEVCALGALFVGAVLRFDEVTIAQWVSRGTMRASRGPLTRYLGQFFSQEQLDLIEFVFERRDAYAGYESADFSEEVKSAAMEFGSHVHVRERAVLIFKNIVANNGTFMLP